MNLRNRNGFLIGGLVLLAVIAAGAFLWTPPAEPEWDLPGDEAVIREILHAFPNAGEIVVESRFLPYDRARASLEGRSELYGGFLGSWDLQRHALASIRFHNAACPEVWEMVGLTEKHLFMDMRMLKSTAAEERVYTPSDPFFTDKEFVDGDGVRRPLLEVFDRDRPDSELIEIISQEKELVRRPPKSTEEEVLAAAEDFAARLGIDGYPNEFHRVSEASFHSEWGVFFHHQYNGVPYLENGMWVNLCDQTLLPTGYGHSIPTGPRIIPRGAPPPNPVDIPGMEDKARSHPSIRRTLYRHLRLWNPGFRPNDFPLKDMDLQIEYMGMHIVQGNDYYRISPAGMRIREFQRWLGVEYILPAEPRGPHRYAYIFDWRLKTPDKTRIYSGIIMVDPKTWRVIGGDSYGDVVISGAPPAAEDGVAGDE